MLKSEAKDIDGLAFFTGYDYDQSGNLTELRYPSPDPETRQGAVAYRYDDAERVDKVELLYNGDRVDIAIDFEYKPFGPRTFTTLGNTLIDSRTFDTRYQPITWDLVNQSSETLLHRAYGFNNDGNLETITASVVPPSPSNRSFGYDEIHRLTSAEGPWGAGTTCSGGKTYTYDKNGNRMCNGESGTATNYSYSSSSNRLDTSIHPSYSYDANGNITADGNHTYVYSDANRLATADNGLTIPTAYTYDGENRRVRKMDAQTTYVFYDPSGRILTELRINNEVNGSATYGRDYVYLPDGPFARVDWSDTPNPNYHPCKPPVVCPPPRFVIRDLLYYHTDHLGTPLAMTNQDGEMVWQAEYLPFGVLFSNDIAEVENNLRFPGQYFDTETGLHQNWFRDYDPKTGRYVEADPIGIAGGMNLYRYSFNNPVGFTDPTGLKVRVCCRPSVLKRDHCYFEENSPDGTRRTWALHNENESDWKLYLVDPSPSCQLRRDGKSDTGGNCDDWRADDDRGVAACIEDSFERYPIESYDEILPNLGIPFVSKQNRNSNTFVRCVAKTCGLWVHPSVVNRAPGYESFCPSGF